MPHFDYYLATISPNCYLAGTRPADIAKKHGATITYKPLDIMALFTRTGGTPPGQGGARSPWARRRTSSCRGLPSGMVLSSARAMGDDDLERRARR